MGLFSVYVHKMPNGKVYVGITGKDPRERWKNGKGYSQNKHLTNAIKLYGWENIEHIIVAEGLTKEQAAEKEKRLIAEYRANEFAYGYNQSTGGEFPAEGSKWTDEMKQRHSDRFKGRRISEEHKEHISMAKKGKPNGKNGMTGALCPKSYIVKQIDEKTGQVVATFFGFNEASRKTGYAQTPIKEAAHGVRKRAYGYLWEYCGGQPNVIV